MAEYSRKHFLPEKLPLRTEEGRWRWVRRTVRTIRIEITEEVIDSIDPANVRIDTETIAKPTVEPASSVLESSKRRRKPRGATRLVKKISQAISYKKGPWFTSSLLHLALLIILMLIVLPLPKRQVIELTVKMADESELNANLETMPLDQLDQADAEPPVEDLEDIFEATEPVLEIPEPTLDLNLPPRDPAETGNEPPDATKPPPTSVQPSWAGREGALKQELLEAGGGDEVTEEAVDLGLRWLSSKQYKSRRMRDLYGSWSLEEGVATTGGNLENRIAATAMAMLAFQGSGATHQGQSYRSVMLRAQQWLISTQNDSGTWLRRSEGEFNHYLYSHALATIALCELYGMTKDERLREPAQRAIDFCIKSQAPQGGWKYEVGQLSDTSVTGWFVLALQSGRMAGLNVPEETFGHINRYLDSVALASGSKYVYEPGQPPSHAMTAEGLLARQYLGWPHQDPRIKAGIDYLNERPISYDNPDVYYWYYATQVLKQWGGVEWRQWNDTLKKTVPAAQVKKGENAGSWYHPADKWGKNAGRLYQTCFSIYLLEVYYRYLPIYQTIKPAEK